MQMMSLKKIINLCFFPLITLAVVHVAAYAADNKSADDDRRTASRAPNARDLMESTAPGYSTPAGLVSECLGRLVFDVKPEIEWPTWYDGDFGFDFSKSFSRNVFNPGDEIKIGNVKIAVIGPLTDTISSSLSAALPKNDLRDQLARLKKDELAFSENSKKKTGDRKALYAQSKLEDSIQETKNYIKEIQEKYQPFEPGLPDSDGYWYSKTEPGNEIYSVFRTNLKRGKYIYVFESTELLSKKLDKEAHRRNFLKFLASFRTRTKHEIPHELGICIPAGFIRDDGKSNIDIKQSLRWNDAPGVLYSIHTGNVEPGRFKSPAVEAAASAAIGMLGSMEEERVKPFVTKRIGPHASRIGALTAQQGGVALTVKGKTGTPYEAYSVFTGYSGWLGSVVLPYILIEMSTRTLDQAPELKKNPPPFQQSMDRLEILLKSTRLRATAPTMPELAATSETKGP